MRYISTFFWMVILLLMIVFVVLNSHTIELNYYVGKRFVYLPLLLFGMMLLGAILGIFAMLPHYLREKKEKRQLKKGFTRVD